MPVPEDIQPPPKARVKISGDSTGTTTGYDRAAEKSLNGPRKGGRPRLSHDISPKPQELPQDPIFAYFEEEAEKEDGANCVFLLWGSEDSERSKTWAVDVPTTKLESEDLVFTSLVERYAKELGFWRRWIYFRKFSKLKPVTFRLICQSSEKFLASIEPLDLAKYHKIWSERKDKAAIEAESAVVYESDGFVEICQRSSNGEYEHNAARCPEKWDDYLECPFVQQDRCEDQMCWIETAPFLSHYFRNPAGARSQSILKSFAQHTFRYQYRDVRLSRWKLTQTRYLQLNGLYVETAWQPIICLCVFLGLLICVVVLGKLFRVSWEIIFGAGSFLVALPMLVLTVLSYYDV